MEITLNVNINAPAFVELVREAMNRQVPRANDPVSTVVPSEVETVSEQVKPAPKAAAKKAAAAPAPAENKAPAAAETSTLTRDEVKARLSDYSADKRYGMDAVFALLAKYKVQKISELPEVSFVAFKQEIDEALTKQAADPLS